MSGLPTDEEIDRALLETEQRIFEKRERRFGADVITWLALAPVWPEQVATSCSFPADLTVLGPTLAAAGLARSAEVPGPNGEDDRHWWMPGNARRDTLAALKRIRGETLPGIAADIAGRLQGHAAELPAVLARWATLARSGWEADRTLRQRVGELLMRGDTGEALAWIHAARFLAGAVGGALVTGVALAERQIELAYRREHDETWLRSFIEREEQIRWVNDLLAAPDDRWALHLLGVGGAGKTMLLRHVTSRLAPDRGIVAVRIDFDHLSPDYPLRRPGQLVAALAGELRMHATAHRQEYLFERLDSTLADLMESLEAELPPADPLANVRRPEVGLLLRMFADIVSQLPPPVLFILDTCEELAKLAVPGGDARVPPAVEATFVLLSELHSLLPSVRVLFAGRRFLASRGAGWEALSFAAEGAAALPPRPFLALRELRGFDEGESDRLFVKMGLTLDPERRAALLSRSREVAPPRVRRLDVPAGGEAEIEAPGEGEAAIERYHPFDLALYSSWLKEEPDLPPEELQGEADPYVERRLLGRIESPELRAQMPFVVLLRRFDRTMAAAALGLAEEDGEDSGGRSLAGVLRAIAAQEWIDVQPDDESQGVFYEAHRALWPRLWRFYSSSEERRAELAEVMRRAGPALAALAAATPVSRIRGELIGAALRALRPDESAALWADLEQRAAEEGALERLRKIGEGLLAEEGPGGLISGPLRHHAVLFHLLLTCRGQGESSDAATGLEAAREALDGRPEDTGDPALWQWLRLRSVAVGARRVKVPTTLGIPLGPLSAAMVSSLPGVPDQARTDILRSITAPPGVAAEPQDEEFRALASWMWEDTASRAQAPTSRVSPFRAAAVRITLADALSWMLDELRELLGRVPAGTTISAQSLARWADALATRGEPIDQVARVRLLAARACAMERRWSEADPLFAAAIEEGERADRSPRTPVLEGEAPPSFAARARIELLSFDPLRLVDTAPPAHRFLPETDFPIAIERRRTEEPAPLVDENTDSDRLFAYELLIRGARTAGWRVAWDETGRLEAGSNIHDRDLRAPSSWAARLLPPPFVSVARTFSAGGRPSRAIEVLDRAIDLGARLEGSSLGVSAAEHEKLRILRRWRAAPGELAERLALSSDKNTVRSARSYLALATSSATTPLTAGDRSDPPFHPAWRDEREQIEAVVRAVLRAPGAVLDEGTEWRTWLDGLPSRFVADLALEEGEEIAVREPSRGAGLLHLSYSLFARTEDALGALFAATLLFGAEVRAGRSRTLLRKMWSEQIEREYSSCVSLFGWPALATTTALPPLVDPLWRPWLERVFAWGAFLGPGLARPDAGAPDDPWYSGEGLFPTEYPARSTPDARPKPIVPPVTASASRPAAAAPWGSLPTAPPLPPPHPVRLEDSPAGAGMESSIPHEQMSADDILSKPSAMPAVIGIPGGAPKRVEDEDSPPPDTGVGWAPPAAQAFSKEKEPLLSADEPAPPDAGEARPGLFDRIRKTFLGLIGGSQDTPEPSDPAAAPPPAEKPESPAFDRSHTTHVELTMAGDGIVQVRIQELIQTFPLPSENVLPSAVADLLPEALRPLLEDAGQRGVVGLVLKDARLASFAWEWIVPPRSTEPAAPDRHVLRLTEWPTLRPSRGAPVLRASSVWSSLFAPAITPESGRPRITREGADREPPDGLACVVGRPFHSSSGVVLRVPSDDEEDRPNRKGSYQKAQQKGPRARAGEQLRPDSHPLFGAPIVVLVPEPVESLERSVAEREQAAMMRRLAHEVARRAGIVLVLPALPARAAAAALTMATDRLSSPGPDLARLGIDLRALVLQSPEEDPFHDTRLEIALEVVLYAGMPQRRSFPKRSS